MVRPSIVSALAVAVLIAVLVLLGNLVLSVVRSTSMKEHPLVSNVHAAAESGEQHANPYARLFKALAVLSIAVTGPIMEEVISPPPSLFNQVDLWSSNSTLCVYV